MLSEKIQADSTKALYEFASDLRSALDGSCFQDTGNVEFSATVSYSYGKTVLLGRAVVYITRNGYDDGKIDLLKSEEFDPNEVHTQYVPAWQKYSYDAENLTFTVTGKSNKYNYDYTVVIKPA